jgi:hypothetical protein
LLLLLLGHISCIWPSTKHDLICPIVGMQRDMLHSPVLSRCCFLSFCCLGADNTTS